MSSSEARRRRAAARGTERAPTDFDRWLTESFARRQGFTALILLLEIGGGSVRPVSCSYAHVIGDEMAWADMRALLDGARVPWDGVAIFAESPPAGGPLIDIVAKSRLQSRIDDVTVNRMTLNEAGLFDRLGRAFEVEPDEVLQ